MLDEIQINLNWAMKFIEKYNKWAMQELLKDPNRRLLSITPMREDSHKIIGFMFSFNNHKISTGRPTLITQNVVDFKHDFEMNFKDHKKIELKYL